MICLALTPCDLHTFSIGKIISFSFSLVKEKVLISVFIYIFLFYQLHDNIFESQLFVIFVVFMFLAIFCHFGQTKYAISKIEELGINNLSGLSAVGPVVYARDYSYKAPHNVFTTGKKMKKGAKKLGYRTKVKSDNVAV